MSRSMRRSKTDVRLSIPRPDSGYTSDDENECSSPLSSDAQERFCQLVSRGDDTLNVASLNDFINSGAMLMVSCQDVNSAIWCSFKKNQFDVLSTVLNYCLFSQASGCPIEYFSASDKKVLLEKITARLHTASANFPLYTWIATYKHPATKAYFFSDVELGAVFPAAAQPSLERILSRRYA